MASVNELIAAAEYQKNPIISGLEGLAQGYLRGQQQELDRVKTLIALRQNQEDRRKQEEAQANLRKQLNARQDASYAQKLNSSGVPPNPVRPQDMVAKFAEDAQGNLSATYSRNNEKELNPIDLEYKEARTEYYKNRAEDIPRQDEERDYKRKERRNTERSRVVDKFNADASVKKSQQMIDGANVIKDLVFSDNPIAAGAIPTFMARASGEVGNLSEADKAPFGGSRAILAKLEAAAYQASKGKLSPDNARFITELANIMEKRGNENIVLLAKKRSGQYSRASDFLNEEDIFFTLVPDYNKENNIEFRQSQDQGNTSKDVESKKPVGRWNPKTKKVEFF